MPKKPPNKLENSSRTQHCSIIFQKRIKKNVHSYIFFPPNKASKVFEAAKGQLISKANSKLFI